MIESITPFLTTHEKVRATIQESIDTYSADSLKRYPHRELSSIRRKTADVMRSCIDGSGAVYLPDEVEPVALAKQFAQEENYTIPEEIIVAVVCRAMVAPINDLYAASAGRKNICIQYCLASAEGLTKKQEKNITMLYMKKLESRKGCKTLRARTYKTYTGEK